MTSRNYAPVNAAYHMDFEDRTLVVRRALSTLRSRWLWVCLAIVVAAGAGFVAKQMYAERQEFTGTVLHTPLPASEAQKLLITSPDVRSLTAMVKAPASMRAVIDGEKLAISPQALADLIDVRSPAGTQTLAVTLRWRGGGEGASVLDRVLEQFVIRCGELRNRRIDDRSGDFNAAIEACESDLRVGREELAQIYRKHGVIDLQHALRTATTERDVSTTAYSQSRRIETLATAQLVEIEKTIALHVKVSASKAGSSKQTAQRLYLLINEERALRQTEAQLSAKQGELDRARALHAAEAGSKAEVERHQSDLAVLKSRVEDNEKISQWKTEIAEIERAAETPAALQQAYLKKQELGMQILASRTEQPALAAEVESNRQRLDGLLAMQSQADQISRRVDRTEAERVRLQSQVDQLRSLRGMMGGEAVVQQPATAIAKPLAAERWWLVPTIASSGTLMLWLGALVTIGGGRSGGKSYKAAAVEMGLPLLAHVPHGEAPHTSDRAHPEVRSLALSLRQRLPRPGCSILFTPVRGGARSRDLMLRTADILAQRDERVLIVEAVLPQPIANRSTNRTGMANPVLVLDPESANAPELGLSDYLAGKASDTREIVRPTPVLGVDMLPAGKAFVSPDALATHRMRGLLDLLRQTYTIILVEGPPFCDTTDVQILAAYQDGVVMLVDDPGQMSARAREQLKSYLRIGMPMLGCVDIAE